MDESHLLSMVAAGFMVGAVVALITGIVKIIFAIMAKKHVLYYVKVIVKMIAITAICMIIFGIVDSAQKIMSGEYIMTKYPASIDYITYGEVFDELCINMEWSRKVQKVENKSFMQMDADCRYDGQWRKITIQFEFDADDAQVDWDTPFNIAFVGFNGENQVSTAEMQSHIYGMFEQYADAHDIPIDISMKGNILHTKGWRDAK